MSAHSPSSKPLSRRQLRDFGLLFAGLLALMFGVLRPWLGHHPAPSWVFPTAGVIAALALIVPSAMFPLYWTMMRIGDFIGPIVSRVILALMFYAAVLPIGLLMRASGADPMRRKLEAQADSYRVVSPQRPTTHWEKPW
ncbi:MAG: sxtJ [Vampirovibrionales bacterium]|nr:sxtJ [Vampirovibrionales bacterium]